MQNKTAQEMMSFDFEAYDYTQNVIAQNQAANHQVLAQWSQQLNKTFNDLLRVQTKSWTMEELCKTPEAVMYFAALDIGDNMKSEDFTIDRTDSCWRLWHGDTLLREYKKGSDEIICYFEKFNLPISATIKRFMQ